MEWALLILILVAGFYLAWNIGANDVANAMGTSVGSGALTLRQAVLVAAVLEFCGAFFFGSRVSETIQTGIIDAEIFSSDPLLLVYAMLSSLLAAGAWLQVASYFGLPVSTTHSIVGALVGVGAVVGGFEAIYWKNVGFIITSWILSPLLGGLLSHGLFSFLRDKIFYSNDPIAAMKKITPFLVFGVIFFLSVILVFEGIYPSVAHFNTWTLLLLCFFISFTAACLSIKFVQYITSQKRNTHLTRIHIHGQQEQVTLGSCEYTLIEKVFGYLQILTACLMAFAHGANDVANAIGPLSAAVQILQTGALSPHATIPLWALALGGIGIVTGLAMWGWRVIETIGKKITELTPTRGFAAEFGTATTIVLASSLGLPISTTHTLVGSVIGVGLARGIEALDMRTAQTIAASWLVTVPAGAFLSVLFFYIIRSLF